MKQVCKVGARKCAEDQIGGRRGGGKISNSMWALKVES